MHGFVYRRWKLIAAGVIVIWLAGCVGRYTSFMPRSGVEVSSADCGRCHQEIFLEWRNSPHANSVKNDRYQLYSDGGAIDSCRGCHQPVTTFTGGQSPPPRVTRANEGVDCLACHLQCGSFWGPLPVSYEAHPVVVNEERYRHSALLCGVCHRKTYSEWQAAPFAARVNTCQGCHMTPVKRRRMAKPSLVSRMLFSTPRVVKTRSHAMTLASIENFSDAVRVELTQDQAGTQTLAVMVRVTNRLPHGIPTGEYGYRKATLATELIDEDENTLAERSMDFFTELRTQLEPLKERQVPFQFEDVDLSSVRQIRVRLERSSLEGEKRIVIGTWDFPLDAQPPSAQKQEESN